MQKVIYALGFFDGVHLGHQALLSACRVLAEQVGGTTGVVTFQQHPQALLCGAAPKLICSFADRDTLLRRFGGERILALPFDESLKNTSWQDFLQQLVEKENAAGFVCGYDFRFGRQGQGDPEKLAAFCREKGLVCRVVDAQKAEGEEISSTAIRNYLRSDAFHKALAMLGHGYLLSGQVVKGKQLGRTIGIPTANLQLPRELEQPPKGVYAARATVAGKTYFAVTNIGNRPTVAGENITVESWLPDFSGDLYGQKLTLELVAFLRPERKFDSLAQLQEEIRKNAAQARKILEEC